jgi:hypothetical protein
MSELLAQSRYLPWKEIRAKPSVWLKVGSPTSSPLASGRATCHPRWPLGGDFIKVRLVGCQIFHCCDERRCLSIGGCKREGSSDVAMELMGSIFLFSAMNGQQGRAGAQATANKMGL